MDGLHFHTAPLPVRSDPARADVACFVGMVGRRGTAATGRAQLEAALRELGWDGPPLPDDPRIVPSSVLPSGTSIHAFDRWLHRLEWRPGDRAVAAGDLFRRAAARVLIEPLIEWWNDYAWLSPISGRSAADLLELVDVPVPLDTWDTFDALFAWNERTLKQRPPQLSDATLGAAIRRFFLQGGRKCYVVRVGDPLPLFASTSSRSDARHLLLDTVIEPSPVVRTTWRGIAHLFGLPDVSFLSVPDLPELFAVQPPPADVHTTPDVEERFVECATRVGPETSRGLRGFPTPRCDDAGFSEWSVFVRRVGRLLEHHAREVQFIASVPLPARALDRHNAQWEEVGRIQTAFVQLAYPWLRTREAVRLPGALEPPDALLVGLLAGNAMISGTWRSAARQPVFSITGLEPELTNSDLEQTLPYDGDESQRLVPRKLRERISVFTPTPAGFHLLSDVTTDDDEAYRPASVNRLVASIARAARVTGEGSVFANNGERLWRRLRAALESVLLRLWGEGALAGASSGDAFTVRCDRSTMTQADLDAGRVVARVQFTAASPIERISVLFAMDEGGQVSLAASSSSAS